MTRTAFSRAWTFLSYNPVAKWSAILSGIATGFLYIALLVLLGLFVDLMVNRGQITTFQQLAPSEQAAFIAHWKSHVEDNKKLLTKLQLDPALAGKDPDPEAVDRRMTAAELDVAWEAYVYSLLEERVNEDAAKAYWDDLRHKNVPLTERPGRGILALVVRTHQDWLSGPLFGLVARYNPWMWQYGHGESTNLYYMIGLLVLAIAVLVVRTLLLFAMKYLAAKATLEATVRLRRALYHHTFRLGTLAIRALGPSEAVSMATRHVEAVHDGLYAWLTVVVREPVKFFLLLAFALAINPRLGLAFLLFALLIWLIGGQIAAYFREQGRMALQQASSHLSLIQESLMMMRLVKCYLMELFNQARVERQLSEYSRLHLARYRGEAIYRPLLVFLGTLAVIFLLFIGGLIVLNGQVGVTNQIVLVAALASLYWPMKNWFEHRRVLRRARESATVLFKFLDRPGEVGQVVGAEFLPPMEKQIEFDDVSLKEPGTGRMLLRGLSFRIPVGTRVAFVGPDDAEKHALCYLIPRFLDPTSGEIRIDQHNLRWVTLDSLRAQIAMVMHHNLVFTDTVANNIGCGDPSFTLPQVIEAAKVAHAHHFIQKLPQGYETVIGEMGHALTAGELFRIGMARAILRDPSIIIIEEPPVAMDEEAKSLFDDTFTRILPGRTVIFLPHRISTIRGCNQIFLIHKGQIEAKGEHRDLLQQNELYQHLHYLEFNMFAGQL